MSSLSKNLIRTKTPPSMEGNSTHYGYFGSEWQDWKFPGKLGRSTETVTNTQTHHSQTMLFQQNQPFNQMQWPQNSTISNNADTLNTLLCCFFNQKPSSDIAVWSLLIVQDSGMCYPSSCNLSPHSFVVAGIRAFVGETADDESRFRTRYLHCMQGEGLCDAPMYAKSSPWQKHKRKQRQAGTV